jgi:RNA polymerase sigma factor (sigma-70 family)
MTTPRRSPSGHACEPRATSSGGERARSLARIDALYRESAREIVARAAAALHRPTRDLEDACQYAWATLVRRPDVLDGPSPQGWLVTVAIHEWLRERRRAPLPADVDRLPAPAGRDPEAALEAGDALARVAALRPVRRRVFARHLAGLSYAEIMAELGLTYTNVSRQIARARAELRRAA